MTFRYKTDAQGTRRYGLIAEEVAKVYPELVVRGRDGRIDGARYDELASMLINELQEQKMTVATLVTQHEADAAKIALLEKQFAEIHAAFAETQSKDQLFAKR